MVPAAAGGGGGGPGGTEVLVVDDPDLRLGIPAASLGIGPGCVEVGVPGAGPRGGYP